MNVNSNLDTLQIYSFQDAIIKYEESGSWRDGAPVDVIIEGPTVKTIEQICGKLEERFFNKDKSPVTA